jgi:hypothetical protein
VISIKKLHRQSTAETKDSATISPTLTRHILAAGRGVCRDAACVVNPLGNSVGISHLTPTGHPQNGYRTALASKMFADQAKHI